jgi:hypothetical protein
MDKFLNILFIYLFLSFQLVEFCEKSKLPQKLAGFQPTVVPEVSPLGGLTSFLDKIKPKVIISNEMTPPQTMEENSGRSPLMTIVDFMRNLRNPSVDGRVLVVKKTCSSKSFFKYLLLNPAALFQDFVTEPRYLIYSLNLFKFFHSIHSFSVYNLI